MTLLALFLAALSWIPRSPLPRLTFLFQVRHLLVPLALAIFPAAMLGGRWIAAAACMLAFLGFQVHFGNRFRRLTSAPGAGHRTALKVMTLNAGDHRCKPDTIRAALARSGADVICLQEVSSELRAVLENDLESLYPHQFADGHGLAGIMTLSRLPFGRTEVLTLAAPLPYQLVEVLVDERPVRIFNLHPYVSIALIGQRSSAASDLRHLARLASEGGPCLVLGDFNTTDQTLSYDAFVEAGLTDAFASAQGSFGPTFPVPFRYMYLPFPPLVRIDFIWHSQQFMTVACEIGEDASSDHLPLFAEFAWRHLAGGAQPLPQTEPRVQRLAATARRA